ncbi:glycoside hydrolase family 99-like domain-containing protein [Phocaeicola plebeius]|uniref:glycosyltransferase WbsX family protein n=1 Tax=Phocaeicola plebeius TaxID=310297 RepID=UPI0019590EDE|nr:glycoside hydrolase family 99-like domain-containing protein [Phocaeicola plebeius]MBM6963899.1 glycoside hydrolase family 99-like domain-containing protein [Phocaeicola plebeius]
MNKIQTIAFYLPQFYPTPENDKWWGKGFTEWTNVGRAKPLFKGHYQPRVPADLGYYDLRIPEVREQQAQMAAEAGIDGFCYWHYWFAGKRLLDKVFSEVVESKKPDFPFCLCWANHSWYAKTWDPKIPDKLLIEQTYPGEKDYEEHFYAMLTAFKDNRYMRINDKLIFAVYDPLAIPNPNIFISTWNNLAIKNGLKGFHFIGFTFDPSKIDKIIKAGFNNVIIDYTLATYQYKTRPIIDFYERIKRKFLKIPRLRTYNQYMDCVLNNYQANQYTLPCIVPNFDHSPRSTYRGTIFTNSTPQKWESLLKEIYNRVSHKKGEKLIFIKAWNEWGEGNYLEPDLRYGKQYLEALSKVINS